MKLTAFIAALLVCFPLYAQHTLGIPDIVNFSKQQYQSGTQNWDIRQDSNGIMYFANNDGLLTYNGSFWRTYKLPDRTHLRSIGIAADGKIYIGGQDNIGYFLPDVNGNLTYHSLNELVPAAERSIGEVWDIITYKNDVFFRARRKILRLSNQSITVYKLGKEWRYMDVANGRLIAQDAEIGICAYEQNQWKTVVTGSELPADFYVTSMLRLSADSTLLTTLKHGIYVFTGNRLTRLNNPALATLSGARPYASCTINTTYLLIATRLDGCFVVTRKGDVIQHFSKGEGLQNNDVLCSYIDRDQNLWLGLDNGIDFIAYNNAIKHIYPDNRSTVAGYSSVIYHNSLYLATSGGLYQAPLDTAKDISFANSSFHLVSNTGGQVWNVSVLNDRLLMGHHEGAFLIENNTARLFASNGGYWSFLPIEDENGHLQILGGGYYGINRFDVNKLYDTPAVQYNFESSRFLQVDEANKYIWVAHPYKGLYRIAYRHRFAESVLPFPAGQAPLGLNNNFLFKIKGKIVLTSEHGVFEYDTRSEKFVASAFFNQLFQKMRISYLREDKAGNIWFVSGWNAGVIDLSGKAPQLIYIPELYNQLVTGFENMNPIDANNVLIGSERGFFHINYQAYKNNANRPIPVFISLVKAMGKKDTLLFGGYAVNPHTPQIAYSSNSFRFEYASTLYGHQKSMEYSYWLEGFDDNWSGWSAKPEKEYTGLLAGTYTFHVKARANQNSKSVVSSYTFTVLPPWYRSWWAYTVYTLLFLTLVLTVHTYQHNRYLQQQQKKLTAQQQKHQEEQQQLQYIQEIENSKKEREIVELKNANLNADIEHKNSELASKAMNLVQKSEMLSSIKEELLRLQATDVISKDSKDFKKLIRTIDKELDIHEDWEQFAVHFDTVHDNFLRMVKERFPDLTPNELKLCAYLRLNLSSKEIAQLMNISLRGVETSRYRLRKKLDLSNEASLYDFLLTVG